MRVPSAAGVAAAGMVAAGIAAATLSCAPSRPAPPPADAGPSLIVLITIDALRADRLGVYGYARPTSPHIDQLARESVVVEDAIAQAPYTKASIASLLTGLYPSSHQTYTVSATVFDAMDGAVDVALPLTDVLPPSVTTLAEALKTRGYATAAFTTNPFLVADFGFAQGFDTFQFLGGDGFAPADHVLGRALRVIDAETRPLFVWVHVMEPHSPYRPDELYRRALPPLAPPRLAPPGLVVPPYLADAPSRDIRVYETLYDAEVRAADAAVGCFLDALRARPGWPGTAVVLTADHGEQFLEHGELEHSSALYDELIRVPLVVRIPGLAPRHLPVQVQLVDVAPTLVALAGGSPLPGAAGRDLLPLLRGEGAPPRPALSERVGEQAAVRTREWKLIAGPGASRELYALTRDPGEQHSLANPRRLAEMEALLGGLRAAAAETAAGIAGTRAPLDPAARRRLEALGYIQR